MFSAALFERVKGTLNTNFIFLQVYRKGDAVDFLSNWDFENDYWNQ